MKGKMGDEQRLLHIKEAIQEIESYTAGIELTVFKSNSMIRFASIKQIEIIGEAAKNISEETRKKYSTIEWKQISGLRNILVHEYFGADADLIWQIIQTDIPELKLKLQ
jgi:uncharacterized protein with HEPN domain